jgi:LPS sulfotransferase NodH
MVLKSPPHTARVRTLLEAFPEARFVHIVRHPFAIFPSTVKLWKSLYEVHGLQVPRYEGLEERIYENFSRMYEAFERDRQWIDPARIREVRYEDLASDPVGEVRAIYEHLGLGAFDDMLPALRRHLEGVAGYRADRYRLDPELKAEIARRWRPYFERYGYSPDD